MGALFIIVVLFLPNGLALIGHVLGGTWPHGHRRRSARHQPAGGDAGARIWTCATSRSNFGGFRAVNGLNLESNKGELRCLIGPNGAGKTTALDVICGKVKPKAGWIVFDRDITRRGLQDRAAGVGRKFQVPSFFRELTVRAQPGGRLLQAPGRLRQSLPLRRATPVTDSTSGRTRRPRRLARSARRLALARPDAVARDRAAARAGQRLILMDEPTAGMTRRRRADGRDPERAAGPAHLDRRRARHGVRQGDRRLISVMHQGKLLAEGPCPRSRANQPVREAYLGWGGFHA